MPFDSTQFDYTKVQPVYDKDNPPKRMSEAIRMAVADVEAQERAGIQYCWTDCKVCTAGAVVRSRNLEEKFAYQWEDTAWGQVLGALSQLTEPVGMSEGVTLKVVVRKYKELFAPDFNARDFARLTPYTESPAKFSEDMLALADRLEAEGS